MQEARACNEAKEYLHMEQWEQGVAMWAPLCGNWHSSGRAELAALTMAAHLPWPVHLGIDNKAVVDKAQDLIRLAMEQAETGGNEKQTA